MINMEANCILTSFIQILIFLLTILYTKGNGTNEKLNNLHTFNVESLCRNTNNPEIYLHKWSATNIQLGYIKNEGNRIHKCKIKIRTEKHFGIASAIEEMNIRRRNNYSNWKCEDYIEFVAYGTTLLQKILGKLDINALSQRNSEKLCGTKSLKGHLHSGSRILDLGDGANSFHTLGNTIYLIFHQDLDFPKSNNTFSIIVTTIGLGIHNGSCEGRYKCKKKPVLCIHPNFVCDEHVNCAIPKSGTDERDCHSGTEKSFYNPIAVTMIVLSGLVAIVLGICILITLICQFRKKSRPVSREQHRQNMREELSLSNAAPLYETVILSEPPKPNVDHDFPPSYDELFPKEEETNKES